MDGLRLHTAWRENTIPFGSGGLTPNTEQRAAIDAELARLDDAVDAVSDLMTAEAVYQVLKGSAARRGGDADSRQKARALRSWKWQPRHAAASCYTSDA